MRLKTRDQKKSGVPVDTLKVLFQGTAGGMLEQARDLLHLRQTMKQHVPEVEVKVKCRRTALLSNLE